MKTKLNYIELLAEELIIDGFNVKIINNNMIEYETIAGKIFYKQRFINIAKDRQKFIRLIGQKLYTYESKMK